MATSRAQSRSSNSARSSYIDHDDDDIHEDDLRPRNANTLPASESQGLLFPDAHVPRYMTASPIPSARILLDQTPKNRWNLFKVRLAYYLPILNWLPYYDRNLFTGDLIAGLTLASLLIPQGLSYATALCKLDAIHGLYAIVFPAITYTVFGMSRQLSVGPEATLSLLVGASIAQQESHSSDNAIDPLAWACLVTLFVGIFTFLLGIVRLGFLDSLMSRALLRGFITGVSIVVIFQQSIVLLGLVERSEQDGLSESSSTMQRVVFLIYNIRYAHILSTLVSGASVLFLLAMRVVKSKWSHKKWMALFPEVLIVVVVSTLLTRYLAWDKHGLEILGDIQSSGLPLPGLPAFPDGKHIKDLLLTAGMISVIGFVESVVIAKTYSSRHNYTVSANRELVALGVSNIVSGLFQGIPAFGSVARSKINDRAGARTQMAGFIVGVVALLAIFFLLPCFYYLPKAVLSSIIFVAVLSLFGELPEDLHFIFKIGAWRDLTLLCVTFLGTVISIDFGPLVAITLSLLLTVKETSLPRISIMGRVKGTHDRFRAIHDDPDSTEHLEDVLIVRIEEPLFFANTGQLKDRLRRLENYGDMTIHPSESPRFSELSYTIFDVGAMAYIDASAVQILMEIVQSYHSRDVQVYFVRLRENARNMFKRSGLLDMVGSSHIFDRVPQAIEHIEKDMASRGILVHEA